MVALWRVRRTVTRRYCSGAVRSAPSRKDSVRAGDDVREVVVVVVVQVCKSASKVR
jgi:hypothetical protein